MSEETDLGLDDDFSVLIGALGLQCSWYARAFVNGIPVVLLVDSGAGTTILDKLILSKLGLSESDLAVDRRDYRTANGGRFSSLGSCEVSLAVDSVLTRRSVVFADLGSEFWLLGMDYLKQFDCVLHCSSGSLNVAGHEVQLHEPMPVPCCRVELVEEVVLEPRSCSKVCGKLN